MPCHGWLLIVSLSRRQREADAGHAEARSIAAHPLRYRRLDGVARLIAVHPLPAFFAITYGVSWGLLLILAGWLNSGAAIAIQTVGPTIGALVVLSAIGGARARADLGRRARRWRVPARWYVVALAGIPAACFVAVAVLPAGAATFAGASLATIVVTFVVYLVVGFFSGPLFEEPGWRGFALPRLEGAYGPLRGTLLLGVLWGAWHLPQFLVPAWAAENGGSDPLTIAEFLLLVIALSVLLTWVYNGTGGSVWLAMVTHASINASLAAAPVPPSGPMTVGLVAFGAIALALIALTRGHLGYDADVARQLSDPGAPA